jgi:acyl transferase domain-containing protein
MLKRLSKALESRDGILGVIFAYRENHGGRSSSLTAPNVEAQTALLEETYSAALASRVSYIETHGTGTRLGDPIEIDGLKAAWQRLCKGTSLPTVWLGAMKSNIGHLEAAAGAASLAKVLLALEHRMLPPNNCFKRLNPYISLEGSPFKILTEAQRWESDGDRVAGISSFGFGGSNGHIVVGDPPTVKIPLRCKPSYLFTVSARTEASLREMQECLRIFLQEKMDDGSAPDIESVSYTLNAGRTHFEYRTAWIAADLQHLVEQLRKPVALSRVPVGIQPGLERLPGDEISHSERLEFFKEQYLHGEPVDWHQLHKGESCLRAHLPTYVFDNRPFWFDRKRSDVPLAATMHSSR